CSLSILIIEFACRLCMHKSEEENTPTQEIKYLFHSKYYTKEEIHSLRSFPSICELYDFISAQMSCPLCFWRSVRPSSAIVVCMSALSSSAVNCLGRNASRICIFSVSSAASSIFPALVA